MPAIIRIQRHPEIGVYAVPANEFTAEEFASFPTNSQYKANITKPRNPDFHRKGFALIKLIFDNQEKYTSFEALRTELKLLCGWYEEHIRTVPQSKVLLLMRKWATSLPAPIAERLEMYLQALEKEATIVFLPKSMSFADMDALQFEEFYDRLVDVAIQNFGIDPDKVLEFT